MSATAIAKATDSAWWEHVHAAADDLEPEMRDAFVEEVGNLQAEVDVDDLAAAIEAGNTARAAALVSQGTGQAPQAVADRLVDVIRNVAAARSPASFGLTFDAVNDQAVRWASRRSAQLVTAVSNETRQAIRDVVTQALRGRLGPVDQPRSDPRSQARVIREMIGLTDRDAKAVARFHESMIAEGLTPEFAERQAAKRAQRYLNRRALNIARTEGLTAANKGQDLLWQAAADQGVIDRRRARRVWIATEDDRTCERCMSLDGAEVPFDGAFTEAVESAPRNRPTTTQTPVLHPSCRCATSLRFDL